MVTFDDVRKIALALPDVEEGTSYGTPAFKVRGKLFARLREENEENEEGDVLVVMVDSDERAAMMEREPRKYFITPHYEDYPWVLVRLGAVGKKELRARIHDAWVLASMDAGHPRRA